MLVKYDTNQTYFYEAKPMDLDNFNNDLGYYTTNQAKHAGIRSETKRVTRGTRATYMQFASRAQYTSCTNKLARRTFKSHIECDATLTQPRE